MFMIGQLRVLLFPPITRETALAIASRAVSQGVVALPMTCHGRKPDDFRIYAKPPEPCWFVQVPWDDGEQGYVIRSCRVIVIGRRTGKVYYDGSAGDEG